MTANRYIMHLRPGLNSKHFHSTYVEKAYYTVDSDLSIALGTLIMAVPLMLIERSRLCASTGFHLLPSLLHPTYNTLTLQKQLHIQSHNLISFSTQIQIHIPQVTWSAQELHETNAIYRVAWNPKHVQMQWVSLKIHTF